MKNSAVQTESDEISLRDIACFIKRNQRRFLLWSFAGLLLALAYVLLSPKEYEARFQLQMAQFKSNSNSNSNGEEAPLLIQRLRMPTTYSDNVVQTCGLSENEFGDYLGSMLVVNATKGMSNVVEMKVRASSPDLARHCSEALVSMITEQQRALIEEGLAGRQVQLKKYQQALQEEQRQLERINKPALGNFAYLARLDQMSWLRTRIDALQEEALLSQMHPTKLVSPIYMPSKAVSPKKSLALLLGIMLGLVFGVLHSLGREGWERGGNE